MIAPIPLLAALLAAAPPLAPQKGGDGGPAGIVVAQASITIRQRVIVRVPVPQSAPPPQSTPIRWRQKKGPRCIPLADIAGAQIVAADSVDMIFRGGLRLRAELEDECPALDFYGGFYLRPGPDGMICADRDAVHTRSGGQCEIEKFTRLVPVPAKR